MAVSIHDATLNSAARSCTTCGDASWPGREASTRTGPRYVTLASLALALRHVRATALVPGGRGSELCGLVRTRGGTRVP
jgi:hypothetical protein